MMSEVTEIPGLVADYDFDLPAECIAARPAVPRDAARLLEVGESLRDLGMRDLPALLRPGDVLVVNDTRVIPARLRGRRPADAGAGAGGGPGGARAEAGIEVTLHRQESTDTWRALARPTKRLRIGDSIDFAPGLCAEVLAKAGEGLAKEGNNAGAEGELRLRFTLGGKALTAAIARIGTMPLPPYIPRPKGSDTRDRHDYQTMFARREGAVAAPTAGLHFTDRLLADIRARGVAVVTVTLHVGAGTFLPVRSTRVRDHRMHAEVGFIGAEAAQAINAARRKGGRVVAVGSTALRLLETAADEDGRVRPFSGETDIFITPGYRFRTVDLLITNFHLPRSTLFMLVSAFSGLARMRAAYAHAMARGYRFYSYGDGCLLHRAAAA